MYASKLFARRRRQPIAPAAPTAADMAAHAADAAALMKALGSPARLMLVCHLRDGERSVGELGVLSGIDQPSLSQQLGVLREHGIVATRREGKHVHYRLDAPAARVLLHTLHGWYGSARR